MEGVLLRPRISPFLAARIEALFNSVIEDEGDTREGLKALAEEEGTITWEEYRRQRAERESRGELPD